MWQQGNVLSRSSLPPVLPQPQMDSSRSNPGGGAHTLLAQMQQRQFRQAVPADAASLLSGLSARAAPADVARYSKIDRESLRGQLMTVGLTFIDSPSLLYVQLRSSLGPDGQQQSIADQISKLNDQLYTHYSDLCARGLQTQPPLSVGQPLAVRYDRDNKWYRGQLTGIRTDGLSVFFVDYGNTETVRLCDVCTLDAVHASMLPCLAQTVSLKGVRPPHGSRGEWPESTVLKLEALLDQQMYCVFDVQATTQTTTPVELFVPGVSGSLLNLADWLEQEGLCVKDTVSDTEQPRPQTLGQGQGHVGASDLADGHNQLLAALQMPHRPMQPATAAPVTVVFPQPQIQMGVLCSDVALITCDGPDKFTLQLDLFVQGLSTVMDECRMFRPQVLVSAADRPLPPDTCCMALFPDDNTWYRAKVLHDIGKGPIEVSYVDFGNTAVVQMHQISTTFNNSQMLMSQPMFGVSCKLENLVKGPQWNERTYREFEKLVTDKCSALMVAPPDAAQRYTVQLHPKKSKSNVSHAQLMQVLLDKGWCVHAQAIQEVSAPQPRVQQSRAVPQADFARSLSLGTSMVTTPEPPVASAPAQDKVEKEEHCFTLPPFPELRLPGGLNHRIDVCFVSGETSDCLFVRPLELNESLEWLQVAFHSSSLYLGEKPDEDCKVINARSGEPCAVRVDGKGMCRGICMQRTDARQVQVLLVDYGDVISVHKELVWKLMDYVMQTPPLAIPVCVQLGQTRVLSSQTRDWLAEQALCMIGLADGIEQMMQVSFELEDETQTDAAMKMLSACPLLSRGSSTGSYMPQSSMRWSFIAFLGLRAGGLGSGSNAGAAAMPLAKCFKCNQDGHRARDCPSGKDTGSQRPAAQSNAYSGGSFGRSGHGKDQPAAFGCAAGEVQNKPSQAQQRYSAGQPTDSRATAIFQSGFRPSPNQPAMARAATQGRDRSASTTPFFGFGNI